MPGKGTRFEVFFPVDLSGGANAANNPDIPLETEVDSEIQIHAGPKSNERPVRIVLVEDEADIRNFVHAALEEEGMHIISFDSADEAIIWLDSNRVETFDILITDLNTPGNNNGSDLAKKVKKLDPNVFIVAASGYSVDLNGSTKDERTEFDHCLPKPYNLNDVRELMSDWKKKLEKSQ